MSALLVGYARVSTYEQDLTAQRDALARLGVSADRIYVDCSSTIDVTTFIKSASSATERTAKCASHASSAVRSLVRMIRIKLIACR